MSTWGWALSRALQYAIATAVIGLVLTVLLGESDSERFASTAYVAAIVAAIVLAIKWFVPGASGAIQMSRGPAFPAVFTFSLGVAALLITGATLIEQPSAEVLAVAFCFALIAGAALVRGGALVAFNERLAGGDRLTSAIRYVAVAGIAALGLCAISASTATDAAPRFGYAALALITLMLAAQLIAPTQFGLRAQKIWHEFAALLQRPVSARVFMRTLQYALGVAIAGLVLAGITPEAYAERFATAAYLAMLFALFALVMLHGVRRTSDAHWGHAFEDPARFAAVVGAALVIGAALAFSPIAEVLAACAFLYVIGASIASTARSAIHAE